LKNEYAAALYLFEFVRAWVVLSKPNRKNGGDSISMEGMNFWNKMTLIFFTSLGLILGAALVGSLGAVVARQPPTGTMLRLAQEIKIWAIVAAIGGTFSTIEIIESGIFQGDVIGLIKQIFYVLSSLAGAQLGYYIILILIGGS